MELNVLQKDDRYVTHYDKIQEEVEEVTQAILELMMCTSKDDLRRIAAIENIAEETLDVIQVCIGILDKLVKQEQVSLDIEIEKHNNKLKARGWIFEKKIKLIME